MVSNRALWWIAVAVTAVALCACSVWEDITGAGDSDGDGGSGSSSSGGSGGSLEQQNQEAAQAARDNLAGDIVFSVPSGTFQGTLEVSLSTELANVEIRYRTDGQVPTLESPLFDGAPLQLSTTTQVRAQAFVGTQAAGRPGTAIYVARSFDVALDLPIVILDNYGAGTPDPDNRVDMNVAYLEFDLDGGVAAISAEPSIAARAGFHVRGQSTATFPKVPYRLELRDNRDEDADWPVLGMPAESDWALRGPYADKALMRDPFFYSLGRDMGLQAPRWAYFELYVNTDGDPVGEGDYQGVYVMVETVKNSRNRVDLQQLRETDTAPELLPGGYIFKFEWLAAEDPQLSGSCEGYSTTCWTELEVADPIPLASEQRDWLWAHIQEFHDTLHSDGYGDPDQGYARFIDVRSFVDQLIINELGREMDSYIRSAIFHKDRDTKILAGPLWDYNLTFGVGGFFENEQTEGWQYLQQRQNPNNDWFPRLVSDTGFQIRIMQRWSELRAGLLSDAALDARIHDLSQPLVNAAERNFMRWPNLSQSQVEMFVTPTPDTWEGQVEFLRNWLFERVAWLDSQWR